MHGVGRAARLHLHRLRPGVPRRWAASDRGPDVVSDPVSPAVVPPGPSDGDLTDEQRRIVAWEDGPLVVIAGAGTGKTRVIVERVRRLLETKGDPRAVDGDRLR